MHITRKNKAKNRSSDQKGMTLIELMVVVAIISILAVIATPIYLEYSVRTKVSEGMAFFGAARTNVTEYWRTRGCGDATCFPSNNNEAALGNTVTDKISSMTVTAGGVITVVYTMSNLGTDNALEFRPVIDGDILTWTCTTTGPNGMDPKYAPPICR
jgi:type IV pilus assembly protein PilA